MAESDYALEDGLARGSRARLGWVSIGLALVAIPAMLGLRWFAVLAPLALAAIFVGVVGVIRRSATVPALLGIVLGLTELILVVGLIWLFSLAPAV